MTHEEQIQSLQAKLTDLEQLLETGIISLEEYEYQAEFLLMSLEILSD